MKLTREMITEHEQIAQYQAVPRHINAQIDGRICGVERLHFLPVIADLVRESFPVAFRYLETGTLFGGSMCAVSCHRCTSDIERYAGIDLFTYYGKEIEPKTKLKCSIERTDRNVRYFGPRGKFALFEGDSGDKAIAARALAYLGGAINMLYLDGAHDEAGLTKDLEIYAPKVIPGGVMIVDDYHVDFFPDVTQVMDELDKTGWNDIGPLTLDGTATFYVMQKDDQSDR